MHTLVLQDPIVLVTNNVGAALDLPDGSNRILTVAVNALPSGATPSTQYGLSVTPQTLSQAGSYFLTYAVALGSEATQIQFRHWVYWTNIYTLINTLLQTNVAASEIDMMFHAVASNFFRQYPILGSYNNLTNNEDKYYLDTGLAYLVAIMIRQYKPQMKPTTALKTIRIQTSEYEFSAPPPRPAQVEEWLLQSQYMLYNLQVVQQAVATHARSTHLLIVNGPTRGSRGRGAYSTIESVTRNILTDDYSSYGYQYVGPLTLNG